MGTEQKETAGPEVEVQDRPRVEIQLNLHLEAGELVSRLRGGSKGQLVPKNE